MKPMTPAQLLLPRYELIADYPGNLCPVGTIYAHGLSCDGAIRLPDKQMDKYPHLFRKMKWWEIRDIGELPRFVRIIKPCVALRVGTIRQVTGYKLDNWKLYCDLFPAIISIEKTEPATKEEYDHFTKQNQTNG